MLKRRKGGDIVIKKKYVIMVFLAFCLVAAFFVGVTTSSIPPIEYDPWYDLNDDGYIGIGDIRAVAKYYDTSGTPINKTKLLMFLMSGYISVPAAAFTPMLSCWQFYIYGSILNLNDTEWEVFVAPVQLPHGAIVTNFTVYWYDAGIADISCYLTSYNSTITYRDLAIAPSTGAPGLGSSFDDTINYATVDNANYAYMVEVSIPSSASHTDYRFYYATIEYEYPV